MSELKLSPFNTNKCLTLNTKYYADMNWRIPVGIYLITASIFQLVSTIIRYSNRSWREWPFGVEVASALAIILGVYLIKKERNKRDRLKGK